MENDIEKAIVETIDYINKRVDFDTKAMKRIETMLPLYKSEMDKSATNSEAFSYIIRLAVDSLFEHDFKKKIEDI